MDRVRNARARGGGGVRPLSYGGYNKSRRLVTRCARSLVRVLRRSQRQRAEELRTFPWPPSPIHLALLCWRNPLDARSVSAGFRRRVRYRGSLVHKRKPSTYTIHMTTSAPLPPSMTPGTGTRKRPIVALRVANKERGEIIHTGATAAALLRTNVLQTDIFLGVRLEPLHSRNDRGYPALQSDYPTRQPVFRGEIYRTRGDLCSGAPGPSRSLRRARQAYAGGCPPPHPTPVS